jgi:L-alanine-DL-glutamate epimerase-like enolase superfamily enzyme
MNNASQYPIIERISATPFRLPMLGALRWGQAAAFSEIRHVLIEVELSDGTIGVGEAPPRPTIYGETVHSIVGIIEQELAPRLIGKAVPTAFPSRNGAWPSGALDVIRNNNTAKGALDIALHHAASRYVGQTLAERLGSRRRQVKVSYILGIGDLDTILEEAERVTAQGVRVLKVKVGRNWQEDLEKIHELRNILDSEVELYADANECFTTDNAASRLAQLRELGLLYCEEPLAVEEIRERAALRSARLLPLIADDSTFTYRDLCREVAFDTFDILNIKTARTGYTESERMSRLAGLHGKGIMIGSQASSTLGTAQAALFAARPEIAHPSELSFFLKIKEDIVSHPLRLENGYLDLETVTAVEVDPDLLRDATFALA